MNASTSVSKSIPTADELTQQIEALRADLTRLASSISEDVTEGIGKAGRQITQTGREARTTATTTITEHPLAAVGIAVAIGVLLGLLARKG